MMKTAALVLLILACMTFGSKAVAAVSGRVAHWTFDEAGADVGCIGTSPNPGSLLGNPGRFPGVLGGALRLDGATQGVEIPHAPELKPDAQITLSAWVLPTELSGSRAVFRKEDGGERILFAFQDGGSHLTLGLNLDGVYQEFDAKISAPAFLDEKWHLITATCDGAFMKIYKDGQQIADGQTVQIFPAKGKIATGGTEPLYLGVTSGQNEHFAGFLDDARLYDRALSSDEIAALYAEAAAALFATGGADMVTRHAPEALARALRKRIPIRVSYQGANLDFKEASPGVLENRTGDLTTRIKYEFDAPMNALRYQAEFTNTGTVPVSGISVEPLQMKLATHPPDLRPRVRYFTGSFHHDAKKLRCTMDPQMNPSRMAGKRTITIGICLCDSRPESQPTSTRCYVQQSPSSHETSSHHIP